MSILQTSSLACAPLVLLALGAAAPPAAAAGAVYTLTNDARENAVLVFQRDEETGELSFDESVSTGGEGTGHALGSQGALALTDDQRFLLAVNAGSHTLSSLRVTEDGLELVDQVATGGKKPVSIAVHDDFVAVLNAGGDVGAHDLVTLFVLADDGQLVRLGFMAPLSAASTSPAQVLFAQEGQVLVVTEKDTGKIDVIPLRKVGPLGETIVHDAEGRQPLGFTLVRRDQIVVTDATTGALSSYHVGRDGSLTYLDTQTTSQMATCGAVAMPGGRTLFATNTDSDSVSSLTIEFDGSLHLLDGNGEAATTGTGPIDAALSPDAHFLYVLASGSDSIRVFHVDENGGLETVETRPGVEHGANGLVAR